MEQIFIAGIIGFIAGGITIFVLKDKIVSIDSSLHAKIDQLLGKVDSNAQAVANHVTAQIANVSGQIAQIDEKVTPKAS